jgi:acetyltransferase
LPEDESAAILSEYGIPTARSRKVSSEDDILAVTQEIGFPVVMKVLSPQVAHRTDIGGVMLGIGSQEEALDAYKRMISNVKQALPEVEIEGVLIQEMIPKGVECIAGFSRDPQFGQVIVCGIGGIFVEILSDFTLRIPPLTIHDAQEMIEELKGYPILTGVRGSKRHDIEALTDTLLRISDLATDLGDLIEELDINPLMVLQEGKGVKAIDALIVQG